MAITLTKLEQLKKTAKREKRSGLYAAHAQALDAQARSESFEDWASLVASVNQKLLEATPPFMVHTRDAADRRDR